MNRIVRALIAGRAIKRSIERGRVAGDNPIDAAFNLMDEIGADIETAENQLNGLNEAWRSRLQEFNRRMKRPKLQR